MTKRREPDPQAPDLRARAEQRLADRDAIKPRELGAGVDATRLVHELEVHQIELEMQNEDLLRSRASAESALALYAELYDFAPVGYFSIDRQGAIRRANLTGARLLRAERARLIDGRLGSFVASVSLPDFNAALAVALGSDEGASCEVQLAPGGEVTEAPTWLQLTLAVAGDEVRVVAVDVTDRRRTQDLLRSSQTSQAIGRLAGGVAHEFNNLLTIILGEADAARAALADGASPQDNLQAVTDAAERAATLTRKLLAIGRKQLLRPEIVDLNALISGLSDLLGAVLGGQIELVMDLSPDLGRIAVEPVQLEQVIVSIVGNAHDAMPNGGRVMVSTANLELGATGRARAIKTGSYVVLTVSDTGTGMDEETLARILEPFFTTKSRQRIGLGLACVSGIVEQCGGQIAVRSALGTGTTFEIYLPRVATEVAAPTRPVTDEAQRVTATILFVDDEEALRRIAKRILETAGYTVLIAASGAEALLVLERHAGTIHLLVSDVIMPSMTGPELADRVRQARPDTRVLFMSGYADDVLGHHGVLGQDIAFLSKPYSAANLKLKVREALE